MYRDPFCSPYQLLHQHTYRRGSISIYLCVTNLSCLIDTSSAQKSMFIDGFQMVVPPSFDLIYYVNPSSLKCFVERVDSYY
jgi:hypothetical protein